MAFIGGQKNDTVVDTAALVNGSPETFAQSSAQRSQSSPVASIEGGASLIGMDLVINGNLSTDGEIHIEGEVQGDIKCASLIIGDNARVTGGIVAEDIVIRGNMTGTIRGTRVTLLSSSHVECDIFHKSLAIEQGAFFEGTSKRAENPTSVTTDGSASTTKPVKSNSEISKTPAFA